jgi:hypothetical protein
MTITQADILAACEVLSQLQEESDDIDFELAADLRLALQSLALDARETLGLIEMEMARQVEGAPRRAGAYNYMAVNKYRDRYDHDAIEARVVAAARLKALNRETGEIDPADAARWAAHLMRKMYVATADKPRKGAMDELELDVTEIREREAIGRRLHIVDPDPG